MGKFGKLVDKLEDKGLPKKEASGIAAKVGMEKMGKKKFEEKAQAGRKKAEKKK
jgi:hypothetical protein